MNSLEPRKKAAKEMGRFLDADFNWTVFGTFTTQYPLSIKSARRLVERFHTLSQIRLNSPLTMYWVAEQGPFDLAYHLHTLIQSDVETSILTETLKHSWVKVSSTKGIKAEQRCLIVPYEKDKGAGSYLSKTLSMRNSEYDFILPRTTHQSFPNTTNRIESTR